MVPYDDATPLAGDEAALHRAGRERGYVYLRGLFSEEVYGPVRELAREHAVAQGWVLPRAGDDPGLLVRSGARMTGRGWDDPAFVALQQALGESPAFLRLANHEVVHRVLAALMGKPACLATANHCWLKLPGSPEHTTRPHQDLYYVPQCPEMWTMWVPLTDTPMEVGPLGVVPGSNRGELLEQSDPLAGLVMPPETRWATQPVRAGDVVIFDAMTVHCAWSNVSPSVVRASLDIRYVPDATDETVYLCPDREYR